MSILKKYLKGWTFRTETPTLEPGMTVNVFVSEYDESTGDGVALIGDTRLVVEGFDSDHLDHRVAVDVVAFDPDTHVARGEFRAVVGESSYTG